MIHIISIVIEIKQTLNFLCRIMVNKELHVEAEKWLLSFFQQFTSQITKVMGGVKLNNNPVVVNQNTLSQKYFIQYPNTYKAK